MDEPQAFCGLIRFSGLWFGLYLVELMIHLPGGSEGVGGDVHGPDGPWFGGAECPRAEDDHEVDENFGQFIQQFVEFGLL